MKRQTTPLEALEQRVEELTRYVLQVELRLERLTHQVEQLSGSSAALRESLKIMGVTEGYSPPEEEKGRGGFDPSIG